MTEINCATACLWDELGENKDYLKEILSIGGDEENEVNLAEAEAVIKFFEADLEEFKQFCHGCKSFKGINDKIREYNDLLNQTKVKLAQIQADKEGGANQCNGEKAAQKGIKAP